jgi:ketosteroid isomerase-like protein
VSQEDVAADSDARLRAWFDRFNETQEPQLELMHPENEWHLRADLPDSRILRGYEMVKQLNIDWTEAFENLRLTPTAVMDVAGKTLIDVHFHACIRGAGESLDMDEVWVLGWCDNKIIEIREYNGRAEALKAVGLEK